MRRLLSEGRPGAYLPALLVALALVLSVFPHWALVGGLPPGAPPFPDFGQHVIGQLYFFSQPWNIGGPAQLLIDRRLESPAGANIAFTDSIPLLSLASKLLAPWLPPFDQTISLYQAGAQILQPLAAVFALRSADRTLGRRWLPCLAVAVIAVSMPVLLARLWHAALSGQGFLLVMLGLYFRILRGSGTALIAGCLLEAALLLIHPYLMVMTALLLLAAPVTLWWRGEPNWRPALMGCGLAALAVWLEGALLGYWGSASEGGFGFYSMNLLSPFWPTFSYLFPGVRFAAIDGTGGQAAGYQYLGAGLIVLAGASLAGLRIWRLAARRHPGLLLMALALTLLAVTNWIFLGRHRLLHLPFPAILLGQLRASGRLFWPVGQMLMIGAACVVLRRFPRAGIGVLGLAAILQFADARTLRRMDHAQLALPAPYGFDAQHLEHILRAHRRLTVLPTFPCNGGGVAANENLLWIAARSRLAVNSIYMARDPRQQACLPDDAMLRGPADGEIQVLLPDFLQAQVALAGGGRSCRLLQPYLLCTRQTQLLAGLPELHPATVPLGTDLPVGLGKPGAGTLLAGWTEPAGAAWSQSPDATLGARLASPPPGDVELDVRLAAMPRRTWWGGSSKWRPVEVWAGDRKVAQWRVGIDPGEFHAVIPASWIARRGAAIVTLRSGRPVSALDLGRRTDPRRFGILLSRVRFRALASAVESRSALPPAAEPLASSGR